MKIHSVKKRDIKALMQNKPEWARYLAMDTDGDIYWFESKPEVVKRKEHWRSRIADARVKYLGNFMTTGGLNNGRVPRLIWSCEDFGFTSSGLINSDSPAE